MSDEAVFIITGGGTAGHTNPAIAVGQALEQHGISRSNIHFVGGVRGNEGRLVTEAGFSIDLLPGRGIQRRITLANVAAVLGLLKALVKGLAIVAKRRPRALLCLGGYASFAATAAAFILRVPIVVSEQNARASAVNRLFGPLARRCALPFPDTDLPNGVLTGNPIRSEVLEAVQATEPELARRNIARRFTSSDSAALAEALRGRRLLAVWSGSLGATRVNRAVAELAELWCNHSELAIYHIIGKRDWQEFSKPLSHYGTAGLIYMTVDYEDHMPDVLVAADFAICRAGASTVSELAVASLPSVLVPLPNAPRDHQIANTGELKALEGALVIQDHDLSGSLLAELLEPILSSEQRLKTMREAAKKVARPNAASDVAELLIQAGRGNDS